MGHKLFPISEALRHNKPSFEALALTDPKEGPTVLRGVLLNREVTIGNGDYTHATIFRSLEYTRLMPPDKRRVISHMTLMAVLNHRPQESNGLSFHVGYEPLESNTSPTGAALEIPDMLMLEPVEFSVYGGDITKGVRDPALLHKGILRSIDEHGTFPGYAAEAVDILGSTVETIGTTALFRQYAL